MSLQTYWLVVPLAGIGLSVFGWIALWLAHVRHKKPATEHNRALGAH